jgi:1-aminocyclopropane-1-carboxylate deaminase/D-cysteine desulfhydrase-like pyridoxal-dependent ACC family enzyme
MNLKAMRKLLDKTAAMMHLLDNSVPQDIATRVNMRIRDSFFGPGYAQATPATMQAIALAEHELDLSLEQTYTGKAMAALLSDMQAPEAESLNMLYWHTYNSAPLDVPNDRPLDEAALPEEFLRYFP